VSEWKAIIFDLDDTLYPERDYVFSGFKAVANWAEKNLGIPSEEGFIELKSLFELGVRQVTFNQWLSDRCVDFDNDLISQLVQVYHGHKPKLDPYPEVPGILKRLSNRYQLGLVSDGYLDVQQFKLSELKIAYYFNAIVFSDEWGRDAWKPCIKPFKMVLERLGVGASQSIYIADNPIKDFLGANHLGIYTVWVRRPYGEYSLLDPPTSEHAPNLKVESLELFEEFFNSKII